ncbi:class F sortase [Candidatus Saccharibacteria bacterium]|nr:class F sortase [Candidatus Saccharibacteria bacterium]
MELKHRRDYRKVFVILYVLAFAIYLTVGLQPADAAHYEISGKISIPSINLTSSVTTLELSDNRLNTPDTIVGSYTRGENKTFLIGHSSTVFKDLYKVKPGDKISYGDVEYTITSLETLAKDDIDMKKLLVKTKEKTLVIMTCAGESLEGNDATHRLIVTAVAK